MIRPARTDDRPHLRRLQALLPEPSPDLLEVTLAAGQVRVSVDAGVPVGYVLPVFGPRAEGGYERAHVAELAVAPTHRREGRATALLASVLGDVEGRVTLAVDPDNRAALSLYRSLGFAVVDRRLDYVGGSDALLLARG